MSEGERSALRTAVLLVLLAAGLRWAADRRSPAGDPLVGRPDQVTALDSASSEAAAEDELRQRPLAPGERLDANRASAAELDRLPGVGPALAAAWVAHREAHGAFRGPDDLGAVRGIGPATLARLVPLLQFPPGAPMLPTGRRSRANVVDLNAADSVQLLTLPGIGPALAGRIVAHRRRSRFRQVDDLLAVRGIGPATLERLRPRVTVGR